MSGWKALIIEDEADSAEVVERILRYHHIEYVVTQSAEDALRIIDEVNPTLLIVDLALPGMNGWELLRTVRNTPRLRDIPAVAVTAFHSINVADEAIRAGFNAYFSKPIEATSFVRELEQIIAGE
jgi:CheY-like chemotaxis protein